MDEITSAWMFKSDKMEFEKLRLDHRARTGQHVSSTEFMRLLLAFWKKEKGWEKCHMKSIQKS